MLHPDLSGVEGAAMLRAVSWALCACMIVGTSFDAEAGGKRAPKRDAEPTVQFKPKDDPAQA